MKYIRNLALLLALCLVFSGCGSSEKSDDLAIENQEPVDFGRGGVILDLPEEFSDYSHTPLAEGSAMAQPTPPPTTQTFFLPSTGVGLPRGPTKSRM